MNGSGVFDRVSNGRKVIAPAFSLKLGGTIELVAELLCERCDVTDRDSAYESSKLLCFLVTLILIWFCSLRMRFNILLAGSTFLLSDKDTGLG